MTNNFNIQEEILSSWKRCMDKGIAPAMKLPCINIKGKLLNERLMLKKN